MRENRRNFNLISFSSKRTKRTTDDEKTTRKNNRREKSTTHETQNKEVKKVIYCIHPLLMKS